MTNMKLHKLITRSILMGLLVAGFAAHADVKLPADNNKDQWNNFINSFAECSAVYNLAATMKVAPEQGTTVTYRELANNALVSGIVSAEKIGLHEDYVQAIYSTKYGMWEQVKKDKAKSGELITKADDCVKNTLPYQSIIIESLRKQTASR